MKLNCNKIKVGCFMFVGCLLSTIIPVTGVDSATVKVKSVSVEEPYAKSVSVAKGKTVQVSASVSVTPNKAKNKKVLYKSKNKKIATISKKGIIKGIKVGKTKVLIISKQNKKKKATIPVQVVKKAITKVTINKKTAKLNVGETVALAAAVQPTKQVSKTVEWSSSNKKIATVTKKGVVKAVSIGTTTIKATSLDGSKKSATCKVTVADTEVLTNIVDVVALSSDQLLVTLDCAAELKRSDRKSVV